jgi:hypothetical protein
MFSTVLKESLYVKYYSLTISSSYISHCGINRWNVLMEKTGELECEIRCLMLHLQNI